MAMTLRLSPAENRALNLLAQAQGCTKQEAAKQAIITAAVRLVDDLQIQELAHNALTEYRDTWKKIHGSE